jgi:hypothetical protein
MGRLTKIDVDGISSLNIPEMRFIIENTAVIGVRGRTLSAPKKRWLLDKLRDAGVEIIIDLRAGDHSDSFPLACEEAGLKYFHFPVDRSRTSDAVIIANLPEFIKVISRGGFYISCALGLHRTDIALSLYYLFNPMATEPPVLYGHFRDGKLKYDDIFQRAGSIFHNLTEADKTCLGWDDAFDRDFANRKKVLVKHQDEYR